MDASEQDVVLEAKDKQEHFLSDQKVAGYLE
jgi:hypothetical protein